MTFEPEDRLRSTILSHLRVLLLVTIELPKAQEVIKLGVLVPMLQHEVIDVDESFPVLS